MSESEVMGAPSGGHIEETVERTARIAVSGHDVDANASLIGAANAEHDMVISKSAVLIANIEGNVDIDRSFADVIVAGDVTGENFGTAVLVTRAADIQRGWVGLAITPNLQVSEDSRVIIGPKAALIIAIALFGIFGIMMMLMYEAAHRVMSWRPSLPSVHWREWGN